MDFLGSILNSMDKPPEKSAMQKALMKREREEQEHRQKTEAENLKNFREKVEEKVNKFLKDVSAKQYKFTPMSQVHRSIVHDVAEVASVWTYSFGEEGVDRHIIIFKKEHAPSEDQLNALRRGEEWNDGIAKKIQDEREERLKHKHKIKKSRKCDSDFEPIRNYKAKYEHLIGKESALEAAKKTEANSSYGCVPSENKKDQRSIEQTLADIRAKRQRLGGQNEQVRKNEDTNSAV